MNATTGRARSSEGKVARGTIGSYRRRGPTCENRTRVAVRLRLWQARILRACVIDSAGATARELVTRAPRDAIATLPVVASYHRVVGHVCKALASVVPLEVRAALQRLQRDEFARKLMAAENLR